MFERLKGTLAGAAAALLLSAVASSATTLSFTFTFTNSSNNGGGTVTGIVRGLTDDATSSATSFEITGNTLGFGLGEYAGSPTYNTFTVTAGVIVDYDFLSFGDYNPSVACCSIRISRLYDWAGLTEDGSYVHHPPSDLVFTRLVETSSIPLPAGLPLMLMALGGLGLVARRRAS